MVKVGLEDLRGQKARALQPTGPQATLRAVEGRARYSPGFTLLRTAARGVASCRIGRSAARAAEAARTSSQQA